MDNKIYCHTTFYHNLHVCFEKEKWYDVYYEINKFYAIIIETGGLLKFHKKYLDGYYHFDNYFYTEQEYNRIKNLEGLLNEESLLS